MTIKTMQQLLAEKHQLELDINRLKDNAKRRARTRRLIQKGALLEKYFNAYDLSVEETEKLLATYANFVKRK
ncbi:hypothetical protein GCM10007425_30560 [Lysinibacillus alkalisoli]|uniref:DUF3847 domain-containing protein n=1 Tax=Lysinibacillus alkalisoli TaxID=1911548 RepID=A0A917GAC3_9BACI|nr:hypothetical protein [Lysinibacillus alkalisoli]GGG33760.1 hypothetical protein GCM10007425_30560 [Lysinibacillus alkalisoli]